MIEKFLKFFGFGSNLVAKTEPLVQGISRHMLDCRPLVQIPRSDLYYKTLAKELENGGEFYNHVTGNTLKLSDDPSFVRVLNGDNELLHLESTPLGFVRFSRADKPNYVQSKYLHFGNSKIEVWKPNNIGRMCWTPQSNIAL